MKKYFALKIKAVVLMILLAVSLSVHGQTYNLTIENDVQVSDRILEFDLFLRNTSATIPLELSGVQAGILVNPDIYNGGTITVSILPGTSQLDAGMMPTSVVWSQSQNTIKLTPKAPPGAGNGTILAVSSPGLRVCRLQITNSEPFGRYAANLTFNFTTVPYPTKVSAYIDGINTLLESNAGNCFSNASNQVLNNVVIPVITGNNSVCQGSTGNLYTTQPGMTNYIWTVSAGGKITAGGTSTSNSVTVTWVSSGNQTVSVNFSSLGGPAPTPTVFAVTVNQALTAGVSIVASPSGPICAGTPVTFTATPVNGGTPAYQWYKGSTAIPGATGATYTSSSLSSGSVITVKMTSSLTCVTGSPATSNAITVVIKSCDVKLKLKTEVTHIHCSGEIPGAIDLIVSGGTPPYQYNWSNGARTEDLSNITRPGVYSVIVKDSKGLTAKEYAIVLIINNPVAIIIPPFYRYPVCGSSNSNILSSVVIGYGPISYKWTVSGQGWSIVGSDAKKDVRFIASGKPATFTLKVVDAFGCEDYTTFVMNGCRSKQVFSIASDEINDITNEGEKDLNQKVTFSDLDVRIYPNPFAELVKFEIGVLSDSHVKIEIFNQSGSLIKVILDENLLRGDLRTAEFDATGYLHSVYIYRITSNGSGRTGTIMKAK